MDALRKGLAALNLETSGERVEKLETYLREIELWNPRYGLVAPGEDIVGRHILDSLSGLSLIAKRNPRRLADVGSGAGFPGIPLAVWLDDCEIFLIERSGRRAGFLRNVAVVLGLSHVQVLEMPVESVDVSRAGFDVVTFRAWSALTTDLTRSLLALLSPEGCIAAYKGKKDVAMAELAQAGQAGCVSELHELNVPGEKLPRHMALIQRST